MNELLEGTITIAQKPLIQNQDINHHIISCRISITIIEFKDSTQYEKVYKFARLRENNKRELLEKLATLENQIRILNDNKIAQEKVILECHKIINELINNGGK